MPSSSRYYEQGHVAGRRNSKSLRKPKLPKRLTRKPGEWLNILDVHPVYWNYPPLGYRSITNPLWWVPKDLQHGTITSNECSVEKKGYKFFVWLATVLKRNKKKKIDYEKKFE